MKSIISIFMLTLVSLVLATNVTFAQSNDRINVGGQDLFLSGGNVAWISFANDIGPGETRLDLFEDIFREVNEHGGNTMRLWLHTNGTVTPAWNGNEVTGPGEGTIEDLRNILDLAYQYDVSLMLCLWSFDMLQSGLNDTQIERNRAILTDSASLQTYINNALIPMVDSLKTHPAINAWEIFNEPEGMTTQFGWTPLSDRVSMSDVQWFVNRMAGAIHRADSSAKVTNGSWNIRASSDIFTSSNSKNYYSDEELIAAGGDEDGTLDYFTVHYYKHFPIQQSPFHNDASHWELDKPLVIAEFYMSDPRQDGDPDGIYGVHWEDLYGELYERGYAGALGWQWFDTWANRTDIDGVDGTLMWPRMIENMKTLFELYPEDVLLTYPGLRINFNATPAEIEEGQESKLSWNVRGAVSAALNGEEVPLEDERIVSPAENTTYTLTAADTAGNVDSSKVTVLVLDPDQINRAYQRPARASSVESEADGVPNSNANNPAYVVDGDSNTRWSSAWDDNEWIYMNLESTYDISTVELDWEAAFGEVYNIDISYDGVNWATVYEEHNGNGGVDSIGLDSPKSTNFVRMYGITRGTQYGFSLWEFEVRGLISDMQAPQLSIVTPGGDKTVETGTSLDVAAEAFDSDGEIQYVSFYFDGDSLTTLTEAPYHITLEDIEEGTFELYAKSEDNDGIRVQSQPVYITGSNDFIRIRYEFEDAMLTGATSVESTASGASGGSYVNIEDSGTMTFTNMGWPEAEEYQLSIGYYLPFDYKEQILMINGAVFDTIAFNPPTQEWLTFDTTFTHSGGIDELAMEHFWGYMYLDYIEIAAEGVSVSNQEEIHGPQTLELNQNYPNPFNPTTLISYSLPVAGLVKLSVFNILGQKVSTLITERQQAGEHQVKFDASHLSSGTYLLRLKTNSGIKTRKMILIK